MSVSVATARFVYGHIIPAAMYLLPSKMDSAPAHAMLLAIGMQESRFRDRVQVPNGPAHGFWQFEKGGGIAGVLSHPSTEPILGPILVMLRYHPTRDACYVAVTHNDVLACVFARLLLWTLPSALPLPEEADKGWAQYMAAWRPGKPHPETWDAYYKAAWAVVSGGEEK